MQQTDDIPARVEKLERAHEETIGVIEKMTEHLDTLSSDFREFSGNIQRAIDWATDKKTRYLLIATIVLLLGPDGVDAVKGMMGL